MIRTMGQGIGSRPGAMALALVTTLATVAVQAQPNRYTTTSAKAIKLYEGGAECMRTRKWDCAEVNLKKAAAEDPKFIEPRIYLGEMYEQRNMPREAMAVYREVLAIDPAYFPPAALHLAELELGQDLYDEARNISHWPNSMTRTRTAGNVPRAA